LFNASWSLLDKLYRLVTAIRDFYKDDHEALNKEWQRRLEYISSQVSKIRPLQRRIRRWKSPNHVPHMRIKWDSKRIP